MKALIVTALVSLIATSAFATEDSYCAPSALAAARAVSQLNGSPDEDLAAATTTVQFEGTQFQVKIGSFNYQVKTGGDDGICRVYSVVLTN